MLSPSRREDLLCLLAQAQDVTAPVTVQIGAVIGGTVRNDCLRITEAPPSIVKKVATWVDERRAQDQEHIMLEVLGGALHIS